MKYTLKKLQRNLTWENNKRQICFFYLDRMDRSKPVFSLFDY